MWTEKNKTLISAIELGDLDGVKQALLAGAEARFENDFPIRTAVWKNQMHIASHLVQQGADIHVVEADGFKDAISFNRPEVVRQLLSLGADPTIGDNEPLTSAAKKGCTEIVAVLVESGVFGYHVVDDALAQASFEGHLETAQMLVRLGADPFGINHAAYNLACVDGHKDVSNFLEKTRAAQVEEFLADMNTQPDFKKWLRQTYKKTDEAALLRAVKMRCFDAVSAKMISAGENLTLEDLSKFRVHGGKDTLLELAIGDIQLGKILKPELWRGRMNDLQTLCGQLTAKEIQFQNVDLTNVITAYHMMVLKDKRPKNIILKRPKPG